MNIVLPIRIEVKGRITVRKASKPEPEPKPEKAPDNGNAEHGR